MSNFKEFDLLNHYDFSCFPHAEMGSPDLRSRLTICTYEYVCLKTEDSGNIDLHRNYLTVRVPSFRADIYDTILDSGTLLKFINAYQDVDMLRRSTLNLETVSKNFSIHLSFLRSGTVEVRGLIKYPHDRGSRLEFRFDSDDTHAKIFITGLRNILEEFPARS
jgi:hypothetical protein